MSIRKDRDIKKNEKVEIFIANFLSTEGMKVLEINKKKNDEFDFLVEDKDGNIKTIELKTEDRNIKKEKDTGNLYVEFECNDKPSGISTSKSDLYMFYLINIGELWRIDTPKLKHILFLHKSFKISPYSGDPNNRTRAILVPRTIGQIKEQFEIIDVK